MSEQNNQPQEVVERMRKALFDARAIVVVSRIELEEDSFHVWNGRIIDMLRDYFAQAETASAEDATLRR